MRRRLFNALAALSLLLFLAVCVSWVVGYGTDWHWRYESSGGAGAGWRVTGYHVRLQGGRVTFASTEFTARSPDQVALAAHGSPAGQRLRRVRGPSLELGDENPPAGPWGAAGIRGYARVLHGDGRRYAERGVSLPVWMPLAAAAVAPLAWLAARGRQRMCDRARRRGGLCAACGYDLRASPQRCPECGAAAGAALPGGMGA